jgi:hypothetical protein
MPEISRFFGIIIRMFLLTTIRRIFMRSTRAERRCSICMATYSRATWAQGLLCDWCGSGSIFAPQNWTKTGYSPGQEESLSAFRHWNEVRYVEPK